MAGSGFTRDEVILALDLLYSSENGRISANSKEMESLSALLNRLPIHPANKRRVVFRNETGITRQLNLLKTSLSTGKRIPNLGKMFLEIVFEYEGRHDELHEIAEAIRKNERYFTAEFGDISEDIGFPEGILLGHLHRSLEKRDGIKCQSADCCEICNLRPGLCYQSCGSLLQHHLIVPPINLDGKKKYGTGMFVTVCPTCHAVLHRIRPWKTKENYKEILA